MSNVSHELKLGIGLRLLHHRRADSESSDAVPPDPEETVPALADNSDSEEHQPVEKGKGNGPGQPEATVLRLVVGKRCASKCKSG